MLPNAEEAHVERKKVVEYLLNVDHPDARGKAHAFHQYGFRSSRWKKFARALRNHALQHPVADTNTTPFGMKYVIEGPIQAPNGEDLHLRSVWITEAEAAAPRLVTAYPIDASETDDSRT